MTYAISLSYQNKLITATVSSACLHANGQPVSGFNNRSVLQCIFVFVQFLVVERWPGH